MFEILNCILYSDIKLQNTCVVCKNANGMVYSNIFMCSENCTLSAKTSGVGIGN